MIVGEKDTEPDDVTEVTFADYSKYAPFIYSNYDVKKDSDQETEQQESSV